MFLKLQEHVHRMFEHDEGKGGGESNGNGDFQVPPSQRFREDKSATVSAAELEPSAPPAPDPNDPTAGYE